MYILNLFLNDKLLVSHQGELVCLEGPVGGGKSSLLAAILGDVNRLSGTVSIKNVESGKDNELVTF